MSIDARPSEKKVVISKKMKSGFTFHIRINKYSKNCTEQQKNAIWITLPLPSDQRIVRDSYYVNSKNSIASPSYQMSEFQFTEQEKKIIDEFLAHLHLIPIRPIPIPILGNHWVNSRKLCTISVSYLHNICIYLSLLSLSYLTLLSYLTRIISISPAHNLNQRSAVSSGVCNHLVTRSGFYIPGLYITLQLLLDHRE